MRAARSRQGRQAVARERRYLGSHHPRRTAIARTDASDYIFAKRPRGRITSPADLVCLIEGRASPPGRTA